MQVSVQELLIKVFQMVMINFNLQKYLSYLLISLSCKVFPVMQSIYNYLSHYGYSLIQLSMHFYSFRSLRDSLLQKDLYLVRNLNLIFHRFQSYSLHLQHYSHDLTTIFYHFIHSHQIPHKRSSLLLRMSYSFHFTLLKMH